MAKPTPIIRPRSKVPISRTKVSYFDPNVYVGDSWDDFGWRHQTGWRPTTRRVIHREVAPVVHRQVREVVPILYEREQPVVTETVRHTSSRVMTNQMEDMEREMQMQMDRLWNDRRLPVDNDPWNDRFQSFNSLLPVEYTVSGGSNTSLALKPSTLVDEAQKSERGALAVNQENPIVTEADGSRKFLLEFDVRQFKPDEINIRTENQVLSVHAVQEFEEGSKQEFREFARQFVLPNDLKEDDLESSLSPDGVLTVTAPLPALKQAIEAPKTHTKMIAIERR